MTAPSNRLITAPLGAGIRSCAAANPVFPHEDTADQRLTESQFESYRSLGLEIGRKVFKDNSVKEIIRKFLVPARSP